MSRSVIWDLDGTLFDSYPVIVESIYLTFQESAIQMTREEIRHYAIRYSSSALFYEVADKWGIAAEALFARYREISRNKILQISPMEHAQQVLHCLASLGVEHYVYTHRGSTTVSILDNLSMTGFFREIVTSENGFARKPAPDALSYLINKYSMDPKQTYYIGDRSLDMICAKRAGIHAVLYQPAGCIDAVTGAEDHIVHDLMQIIDYIQ